MSLIKGKQEFRTILDFSKEDISKNLVKQALREAEVCEVARLPESGSSTLVENYIIVGMYQIHLLFSSIDAGNHRSKLKEYGGFRVAIYERNRKGNVLQNINLDRDRRFKTQYWAKLNHGYDIRMKNLVDIIIHLKRLNNLKMFL